MSTLVPPTSFDRLLSAFRALVRAEDPNRAYRGIYEYRVGAVTTTTADVSPTDSSLPLPSILRVPLAHSLLGEAVLLTVGTTCLLGFVNGDPARPVLIGVTANADQTPQNTTVDATAAMKLGPSATSVAIAGAGSPVARLGDQVMVFLPPSLPVTGTLSGSAFTGTITVTNPITGSITGGSSKATSG